MTVSKQATAKAAVDAPPAPAAAPKIDKPGPPAPAAAPKIDKPGIYPDVSMAAYHGDLCAGFSVSASTLALMDERESCPAKAWAHHYGNPDVDEDKDTAATAFGSATHMMILEGEDRFFEHYVMKPAGMKFSTKEGMAWRDDPAIAGRAIVTEPELDTIRKMAKTLLANPDTRRCFTGGKPEVTAVIQDPETGLWLKSRPDYWRPGLALNYKTARNSARWMWPGEAWKRGHHVSAALCVDVLKALGETANYAFVIQEKEPPFLASVRVLDDAFLEAGRMVYRAALRRFAECLAKNEWPGYPGVETIKLPAYADRLLADAVDL